MAQGRSKVESSVECKDGGRCVKYKKGVLEVF